MDHLSIFPLEHATLVHYFQLQTCYPSLHSTSVLKFRIGQTALLSMSSHYCGRFLSISILTFLCLFLVLRLGWRVRERVVHLVSKLFVTCVTASSLTFRYSPKNSFPTLNAC